MRRVNPSKKVRQKMGLKDGEVLFRHTYIDTDLKSIDAIEGKRSVAGYLSTITPDADKEVLIPSGAKIGRFLKNPLMLFGHRWHEPPIGKWPKMHIDNQRIAAAGFLADPPEGREDKSWFPWDIHALVKQDILKGISVGFGHSWDRKVNGPPTREELEAHPDWDGKVETVIRDWELYEASIVPLPCNEDALVVAVGKGLISEALKKEFKFEEVQTTTEDWIMAVRCIKGEIDEQALKDWTGDSQTLSRCTAILQAAGLTEDLFEELAQLEEALNDKTEEEETTTDDDEEAKEIEERKHQSILLRLALLESRKTVERLIQEHGLSRVDELLAKARGLPFAEE